VAKPAPLKFEKRVTMLNLLPTGRFKNSRGFALKFPNQKGLQLGNKAKVHSYTMESKFLKSTNPQWG